MLLFVFFLFDSEPVKSHKHYYQEVCAHWHKTSPLVLGDTIITQNVTEGAADMDLLIYAISLTICDNINDLTFGEINTDTYLLEVCIQRSLAIRYVL